MLNSNIKKLGISFIFSLVIFCASGQKNYFGVYGNFNDYVGDLNNNVFEMFRTKYFKTGVSFSLEQNLSPFFNTVELLSYDWAQYQNSQNVNGVDAQFLSLNLLLKYKLNNDYIVKSDAVIAPFVVLGGGGTTIHSRAYSNFRTGKVLSNDGKFNLLAGVGFNIRIKENLHLELSSKAYMPLYDGWDGVIAGGNDIWANDLHVQHSVGIIFPLKGGSGRTTRLDSDHDGVPDNLDQCPETPQGVQVDAIGCPLDTDGDGIPDYIDRCPTVPGSAVYNGCPATTNFTPQAPLDPDSDGDGVPDSRDKCANTPINTPVDINGCPLNKEDNTDSDGDGIPDRKDRCPNSPGPASNNGCPEIKADVQKRLKFATRGIYFETGRAIIKPQSYPMLDEIADIINQYPDYNIRLNGHTDNVGGDASNMQLSQNRVNAVKSYLVDKGIPSNKLEATGYGKTKPVATNATTLGRALNRRVEIELYLK
jgi:outer membrane protein OmpA-like peptidoglycan-associated protein